MLHCVIKIRISPAQSYKENGGNAIPHLPQHKLTKKDHQVDEMILQN